MNTDFYTFALRYFKVNKLSSTYQVILLCLLSVLSGACTEQTMSKEGPVQAYFSPEQPNDQDTLPFICRIEPPTVTDSCCYGTYRGVEFIPAAYIERLGLNGTDVAHQYSNKICGAVGEKLKQLYADSLYSRVDFSGIKLETINMSEGENYVEYSVYIPFIRVPKNLATTGFDHCGGWGHKPEIKKRKTDLLQSKKRIVKNKRLYVSRLFKTKEGLEEYWIQWQHSDFQ